MTTYKGQSETVPVPLLSKASNKLDKPEVEGVDPNDPDGNVPEELIPKGLDVVIKRWNPFSDKPPRKDRLKVGWEFGGVVDWVVDELIYPVPPEEIVIGIGPDRLTQSGVAYVFYEVWLEDLNSRESFRRKLTIEPSPVDIAAPEFRGADIWGQLHCKSIPKLWEGVRVFMKPDPGFRLHDFLIVDWKGYPNEAGTPPFIPETEHQVRKEIETPSELANGVEVLIPYEPYVEPMVKNASASARCSLERNGRIVRKSTFGRVKISRMEAGQDKPCEPPK